MNYFQRENGARLLLLTIEKKTIFCEEFKLHLLVNCARTLMCNLIRIISSFLSIDTLCKQIFSEFLTIVHDFALQFIWFNWFQWVLILLISYLVLISKSLNSDSDKRTQMNAVNAGFFLNHKTNKTAFFTTETL